jgi:hypothetical protein
VVGEMLFRVLRALIVAAFGAACALSRGVA